MSLLIPDRKYEIPIRLSWREKVVLPFVTIQSPDGIQIFYDTPFARHSPPSELELKVIDSALIRLAKQLHVYRRTHSLDSIITAANFDQANPPLPDDNLIIRIGVLFKTNGKNIVEKALRKVEGKI